MKLSLKIQNGDKVKRLLEKPYDDLSELRTIIEGSFKSLEPNSYTLKYLDNENDWLYIFDNTDLQALKEYHQEKNGKSIKLVVETQEELAQSVVEPKKLADSIIKDSCVAEVEAFLEANHVDSKQLEELKETVSVNEDDSLMEVEVEPLPEVEPESLQIINELKEQLESTNINQEKSEIDQVEPETIEPVIIDETSFIPLEESSAFEEISANIEMEIEPVPEVEETIDTTKIIEEEKEVQKEPLKDFDIMDLFKNVNEVLNKEDTDFKPKDLFHAAKDAIKGTKAETKIKKVKNQCNKGKGFFFKKIVQSFLNGGLNCPAQEDKSKVVHSSVTCDGCNKGPVVGVRYKCSECADFDLCEDCEAKDVHNHHVFLKLKNPMKVDIIYSHRTNDDNEAQNSSHPPQAPHHPPHGHHPQHPYGGQAQYGNPWGRHGGRGNRRCRRGMDNNNPLMQLAQQFLGNFNEEGGEKSSSPNRANRRQGTNWVEKRPVIINKPLTPIAGVVGGMAVIETTIQNQSPFPYNLKNVKMIEGDEGISFEEIECEVKLKRDESQDFCLAVQLPSVPGTYKARFAFVNKNNQQHGEALDIVFEVVSDSAE